MLGFSIYPFRLFSYVKLQFLSVRRYITVAGMSFHQNNRKKGSKMVNNSNHSTMAGNISLV
jgi:hypothetical protein